VKDNERRGSRGIVSNWRKHKKSTFQIKNICQKVEQGRTLKYSMFDAWIPIKDAETEIKRLKKEYARTIFRLRRQISRVRAR
jgi:hypothetical protein